MMIFKMFTKTKIKVIAPHSAHHYIFVPKSIAEYPEKILQMLDMHCGEVGGIMTENKGEGSYISLDYKSGYQATWCWWRTLFVRNILQTGKVTQYM